MSTSFRLPGRGSADVGQSGEREGRRRIPLDTSAAQKKL